MVHDGRPVYRHIIVKRKGYIEAVASPEDLRRFRQQIESESPLDEDLKHLYVKDTLKKTMQRHMARAGHGDIDIEANDDGLDPAAVAAEATAMKERGEERTTVQYKPQEGYIVSRLTAHHVPGGGSLPLEPTMLVHPGFEQAPNAEAAYLESARELQRMFQEYSDRKFRLMDPDLQAGVTLVTVCITPITAAPKAVVGVELYCEFHQVTQFGYVDTEGFEVYSEVGEYPIQPPTSMDLTTMMKTRDELGIFIPASRG